MPAIRLHDWRQFLRHVDETCLSPVLLAHGRIDTPHKGHGKDHDPNKQVQNAIVIIAVALIIIVVVVVGTCPITRTYQAPKEQDYGSDKEH